jgi:hypothetical protein
LTLLIAICSFVFTELLSRPPGQHLSGQWLGVQNGIVANIFTISYNRTKRKREIVLAYEPKDESIGAQKNRHKGNGILFIPALHPPRGSDAPEEQITLRLGVLSESE